MNRGTLFVVASVVTFASSAASFVACATEGEPSAAHPDASSTIAPVADASVDAMDDVDTSGGCVSDCEFYPNECTPDALCHGGVFEPSNASSGLDLRTHVNVITGRAPNDIWLAGTVGALAHFDGNAWTASPMDMQESLNGVWLLEGAEVAFGDPNRLYTRGLDAGADASVSAGGWELFGAAVLPPSWDALGAGNKQVQAAWAYPGGRSLWIGVTTYTQDGGLWRMRHSTENGTFDVTPMSPLAQYWPVPVGEVYGIHGPSADEIWAVGPSGAAFRLLDADSDNPTLSGFNTLTANALFGVWAAASNDVWAVGATGTVRRYRGDPRFWEIYDGIPTTVHLRAIAGSSPNDIWVTGDDATAFHFDGATWTRLKIAGLGARRPRLDRIWISAPGKVWIAGQGVLVSPGGKP